MASGKISLSRRLVIVLLVFGAIMLALIGRLFYLQGIRYEYYLGKVLNNIQQERTIKAERGSIYDRNGNLLATNSTTWRVFISPFDIDVQEDENTPPTTAQANLIADGLSELLGVERQTILKKTEDKKRKDETILRNVEKELADQVLAFVSENHLTKQVHLEATSKRYYPYGSLACQVIGVMGTDKGLSGLELYYNEYLQGTDGVYRTATNGSSESMPTKYETFIAAQDGGNLYTTLDVNIQRILEEQLKETYETNHAENRVCGVVLDVNDGSVLAMATYPVFDLNDPYTLVGEYADKLAASGLVAGSDEYDDLRWELVYQMWNNKVISDTYNPGSTFKIITTAAAMNEGVIDEHTPCSCNGVWVDDTGTTKIKCAAEDGHGEHDFTYMLQQSCNPTMIRTAMRLGRDTFWKYFVDFGFTDLTGIDLPGESRGINYDPDRFSIIDLAVSAFGQGFKTTALQEITAISAVAGGGTLVTPHLMASITDQDGNVLKSFENAAKRNVVSADVCATITKILAEGVAGEGGARNANVLGYSIAAKTGTSEKKDTLNEKTQEYDLRVGSCAGYAPADDPQIAVLIVVDEPNTDGSSSRAGGVVAAPFIAGCMEEILPYLGVQKKYTEEEMSKLSTIVGDYTDKPITEVQTLLANAGLRYEIIGTGDTVLKQVPAMGEMVSKANSTILLYTGTMQTDGSIDRHIEQKLADVPDIANSTVSAAIRRLVGAGFNINITGAVNYDAGSGAKVQSYDHVGEKLPVGSVITIVCVHTDVNDAA